jgi:hypothetical protein
MVELGCYCKGYCVRALLVRGFIIRDFYLAPKFLIKIIERKTAIKNTKHFQLKKLKEMFKKYPY